MNDMQRIRIGLKLDSFNGSRLTKEELEKLSVEEFAEHQSAVVAYMELIKSVTPSN